MESEFGKGVESMEKKGERAERAPGTEGWTSERLIKEGYKLKWILKEPLNRLVRRWMKVPPTETPAATNVKSK